MKRVGESCLLASCIGLFSHSYFTFHIYSWRVDTHTAPQRMGDLNQAIELFRRAARSFCANTQLQASVLCCLATALQRRGRLQIDAQVNIFSVSEEDADARRGDGGLFSKKSDEGARAHAHDGLALMNDLDEAAVWYERGLAVNSRSVACLCNYGTLQLHRNFPKKALRHFARAIHIEPYNFKALAAYAAVLDDVGKGLKVVERMYMRALQHQPDYVMALNGLGTVAHRLEYLAEAEAYYKQALFLEPTNQDVTENLEILREATFAQQWGGSDRIALKSRETSPLKSHENGRLPSRGGVGSPRPRLLSHGSARSKLCSRDGPSYLQDRPLCRDLSNLALGNKYAQVSRHQSRRTTPNHVSVQAALADELGIVLHNRLS